jgi:undecaprenyl diphosphate synthase
MQKSNFAQHPGQKANKQNPANHVAIIMDGNGRWANMRGFSRTKGHRRGVETVREIIQACLESKVKYLTLFAFGVENYKRPTKEVRNLFRLFLLGVTKELSFLKKNNVCLKLIGDRSRFPTVLQKALKVAERDTEKNSSLQINLAVNFSGRWDLLNAIQKLHVSHPPEKIISEQDINNALSLANVPEPDVFIRTGGEKRLSNFLLWDLAYTELFFSDTLWPDFSKEEFMQILNRFSLRERRFGLTGEQLES